MRHAALDLVLALEPDSKETHATVVALLEDPYFRMREWAAQAAADYGIRTAIPVLARIRDHDRHGGPRRAARGALERLKDGK
jgi:hypothetical protein